jgi:hypothetical protein
MKNLIILAAILAIFACKKESKKNLGTSDCLDAKITVFKQNPEAISVLKVTQADGTVLFWFKSQAPTYDGLDYILNHGCDTVCTIGGNLPNPSPCIDGANESKMIVIWKK